MSGFGAPFKARSFGAVKAAATPPSGAAPEVVWHQLYDTQTYPATGITQLTFFATANADKTLCNLDVGGQLPSPQSLQIHNVALDLIPALAAGGVSTSASAAGNLDDFARILLIARPTWTLNISNKAYGPYSLTALHGTGGPDGFIGSSDGAEIVQYARNANSPGWNYYGRVIIPEQVSFNVVVNFQGTLAPTAAAVQMRLSLFGVLNRRVL